MLAGQEFELALGRFSTVLVRSTASRIVARLNAYGQDIESTTRVTVDPRRLNGSHPTNIIGWFDSHLLSNTNIQARNDVPTQINHVNG
jgi:hypothetical protein